MSAATSQASAFDLYNLPDPYYASPYPYLRALRDHDPIHRNSDGSVLLTRYDDIRAVWRDTTGVVDKTAMFTGKFGSGAALEHHTSTMLFRDPPDHTRLRKTVGNVFIQPSVERLRPFVEARVQTLLNRAEDAGHFDFVEDLAFGLPIAVICQVIGLPLEDADWLHSIGVRVLFVLNPSVTRQEIEAGNRAVEELKAYLIGKFAECRLRGVSSEPNTVIEALVSAQKRGEITEDEMAHMCIVVLNGGHETTTNLLAISVHGLLTDREQFDDWRVHPEITGTAVEECLRYVTPLQLQGRRTTRDIEVPSGKVAAHTEIILSQASANRDERQFAEPDRLRLRRDPNAHLAFGSGVHLCIGRPLARLEISTALPAVLARFPNLELDGPPEFYRNARFRGLRRLPVRVK